jgi:hypothetical protein
VIEPGIGWTEAKAAEPATREMRAAEMMVFMVLFLCAFGGRRLGAVEGPSLPLEVFTSWEACR